MPEGCRRSDARTGFKSFTAAIVAACLLVPAAAAAQEPLPIEPPSTGIPLADELTREVQREAGALAPDVVDPGPSGGDPQPAEPGPGEPVDPPPADPRSSDPPPRAQPIAVGVADSPANQLTSPGSGQTPVARTEDGGARADASTGATPVRPATGARPEGQRLRAAADEPASTVLERIVGVVPTPVKIAIGMLVAMLAFAIAGARRTQRRLALAEQFATTDALTGLPNRRHADEVLERLLAAARRTRRPLAVVLFDLDHFKAINDNFGHSIGDEALRAIASATRELLRGSDHAARFGGEEFLLLLPETSADDALIVAEKLRAQIAELEVEGLDREVTASFGVAAYPDHEATADRLIEAADAALYRAKAAGRNRVKSTLEVVAA